MAWSELGDETRNRVAEIVHDVSTMESEEIFRAFDSITVQRPNGRKGMEEVKGMRFKLKPTETGRNIPVVTFERGFLSAKDALPYIKTAVQTGESAVAADQADAAAVDYLKMHLISVQTRNAFPGAYVTGANAASLAVAAYKPAVPRKA